ncbi:MAG: glycosyltransferase, partial [Sphingopyxis sp.]
SEADELAAFGFALPRVAIIPNGADAVQPSRAEQVKTDDQPFLLSLGRINWKKNLPVLIAALARCDQPSLRLVIVGNDEDGDLAAVHAAIADNGAANRVTLIDRNVIGDEKAMLFGTCAAFILPSLSENFGNVVVEAMAHGAPIIVTDTCGVAEVVRAADCGIVCAPDAASLSLAIGQLFGDPALMHQRGQAGRAYVRAHLEWPAIAVRMDALYQSVVKTRHA